MVGRIAKLNVLQIRCRSWETDLQIIQGGINTVVVNNSPLQIWNGDSEIVVNNILVANEEALSFNDATQNMQVDYNLCLPPSDRQGPHGITGDPKFVDAGRGVFWLGPDSPAIGKGSSQHAPAEDFWGRPLPKDKAPDLGAFTFVPSLVTEQARAGWDYGWPYHRHGKGIPDLWMLPPSLAAPTD